MIRKSENYQSNKAKRRLARLLPLTILTAETSIFAQSGAQEASQLKAPAAQAKQQTGAIASPSVETSVKSDFSRPSGTGFSAFFGLDSAYLKTFPTKSTIESRKTGYFLGAKLIGSIFTNSMIGDLGGGILQSSLEGNRDFITTEKGQVPVSKVTISTRIGFVELSPRYRFTPELSLGFVGFALFGEDGRFGSDNPLSEPNNSDSVSSVATAFGGLSAVYEWASDRFISRVGISAITDINIIERQALALQLSLQVGFPILKQRTILENTSIHKVQEQVKTESVEKVVTKIKVKEEIKVLFDNDSINFQTNSDALSPDSIRFLTSLGNFLARNDLLWGRIIIEGHTDARGQFEHNMNLSRDRAAAVRRILVKSGIPEARTQSGGYGSARPVDPRNTPLAWARNRRVEMTFSGVRDKAALNKVIESAQTANRSNPP